MELRVSIFEFLMGSKGIWKRILWIIHLNLIKCRKLTSGADNKWLSLEIERRDSFNCLFLGDIEAGQLIFDYTIAVFQLYQLYGWFYSWFLKGRGGKVQLNGNSNSHTHWKKSRHNTQLSIIDNYDGFMNNF